MSYYDPHMTPRRLPPGPGIAKVRAPRPFAVRDLRLVRAADVLWSSWFEHVDTVSEGAVTLEGGEQIYRGSTSVIVLTEAHGGGLPDSALDDAMRVARVDPHFWLHAIRIARREAVSRSPGPLDTVHVEVNLQSDRRGIRADIDVEARVVSGRRLVKTKG